MQPLPTIRIPGALDTRRATVVAAATFAESERPEDGQVHLWLLEDQGQAWMVWQRRGGAHAIRGGATPADAFPSLMADCLSRCS